MWLATFFRFRLEGAAAVGEPHNGILFEVQDLSTIKMPMQGQALIMVHDDGINF